MGASIQIQGVPYRGPARATWLVGRDPERARNLPPIMNVTLRYTFNYVFQSDWESDSELWDWGRERTWRPGYKNILTFRVSFSFLRLGAPLIIYGQYRNQSWLGGRNTRAANVWTVGMMVPFQIWGGRGGSEEEETTPEPEAEPEAEPDVEPEAEPDVEPEAEPEAEPEVEPESSEEGDTSHEA